jgi:hypothetical protein
VSRLVEEKNGENKGTVSIPNCEILVPVEDYRALVTRALHVHWLGQQFNDSGSQSILNFFSKYYPKSTYSIIILY